MSKLERIKELLLVDLLIYAMLIKPNFCFYKKNIKPAIIY